MLEKAGQSFFQWDGLDLVFFCGCVAGGYGVLDNRRFRQIAALLLFYVSVNEKFAVILWLIMVTDS